MAKPPQRVEIHRTDLHQRIWSKPLPDVAEDLNVSEDTLKRICGLLEVPLPKRGHWLRSNTPKTRALRPRGKSEAQSLWLVEKRGRLAIEQGAGGGAKGSATASGGIAQPHKLVARAREMYAYPTLSASGLMKPTSNSVPSLRVSERQRDRALLIADGLLKELERQGLEVVWRGSLRIATPDGEVRAALREEVEEVERPPTPEEEARDKGRLFWEPPRYTFQRPTGVIQIAITSYEYGLDTATVWRDEPGRPLESRVVEVAEGLRSFSIARAELARRREERRRALAAEEARRAEERARQARETAKLDRLTAEVAAWEKATKVRAYADAAEAAARARGEFGSDHGEWIDWIRRYADSIDPVVCRTPTS